MFSIICNTVYRATTLHLRAGRMRTPHRQSEKLSSQPAALPARFRPIIHLTSGDIVASLAETPHAFTDTVSFGPAATLNAAQSNPAKWLAEKIETVAAAARLLEVTERPIIVRAPVAAFAHSGTGKACEIAAARSKLCPQEICLEFCDSALAASPAEALSRVRLLRQRGFRISIDARKAWNTDVTPALRLCIDTYRVQAESLYSEPTLQDSCERAAEAGISVVAHGARWRDADLLDSYGILYAINPVADA